MIDWISDWVSDWVSEWLIDWVRSLIVTVASHRHALLTSPKWRNGNVRRPAVFYPTEFDEWNECMEWRNGMDGIRTAIRFHRDRSNGLACIEFSISQAPFRFTQHTMRITVAAAAAAAALQLQLQLESTGTITIAMTTPVDPILFQKESMPNGRITSSSLSNTNTTTRWPRHQTRTLHWGDGSKDNAKPAYPWKRYWQTS